LATAFPGAASHTNANLDCLANAGEITQKHMPDTFYVWDDENDVLMTPSDSDQFMREAAKIPGGLRAAFSQSLRMGNAE
jgi:hypothetical protein